MAKKANKAASAKSAFTLPQVRAMIDLDEPDYDSLARKLGPTALPYLQTIVKGADAGLASKATYLVSLIPDERSANVLAVATRSQHVIVRVAAASAMRNLPQARQTALVDDLLKDVDIGVRKVALRSIEAMPEIGSKDMVQKLAVSDPDEAVRNIASQLAAHMP